MDFIEYLAGKDDNDRRIDRVIKKMLPDENLSGLYKAIRSGLIKIDDKKAKQDTRVYEGNKIKIAAFLLKKQSECNYKIDEKIIKLLEESTIVKNKDFWIINKPYDYCVQGGEKNNLADIIAQIYKTSQPKDASLSFSPGPLHRLDRKTTGILCFSQSLSAAQWFSRELQQHNIHKTYLGIAQGKLKEKQTWNDTIDRDEYADSSFRTVSVNNESASAKIAITTAEPLAYGKYKNMDVTLVKYDIGTGRTHQIRAQSSVHGHPLLGDTAYGGIAINENQSHYLHAYQMIFPQSNNFGLSETVTAFILTNFKKMLDKILINWDRLLIL